MTRKVMYLAAYLAIFLCTNGLLFKVLHWKGANMMLLVGVLVLNLAFLPIYFFHKYKKRAA